MYFVYLSLSGQKLFRYKSVKREFNSVIPSRIIISFSVVRSSCVWHDTLCIRTRKIRERSMRCVSWSLFKERPFTWPRSLYPCIYMEEILVKIHSFRRSKRPRISLPLLPSITRFTYLLACFTGEMFAPFCRWLFEIKIFLRTMRKMNQRWNQ